MKRDNQPAAPEPSAAAAQYGGLRVVGDLLDAADIPGGASIIHVILMRLERILDRDMTHTLEQAAGIKVSEWRILFLLATAGPMPQRDLVRKMVIEQSHASRVMKAMQAAGLIAMTRDADDLRRWTCSLTLGGRAVFEKVAPIMMARRERIDSVLSESELQQFIASATRVAERVATSLPEEIEDDRDPAA